MRIKATLDLDLIEELDREIFPDDELVDTSLTIWWVMYDGKLPIGYAGLKPMNGFGYLARAGIIPGYTGKGLQRKLIRVREKMARFLHLKKMITYTSPDNYPSANNLIKCGYKLYNPAYAYGMKHAFYFYKHL